MAEVQEELLPGEQQQAEAAAADEEAELAKLQAELYGAEGDGNGASEDSGSEAAQAEGGEGGEAAVPMTKSQMKKKARLERMLAKRAEGRQREKAAKAQRRAEATERKAAELASMTEEQKEALRKEKQAKLEAQREADRQLKERLKQSLESGPRVVIDLDWEGRMTENDMRHLVQQINFSYAANKQAARPTHMLLTSFKGGLAALANKMISGMDKWCVTRTEQHYAEMFCSPEDKSSLVYLTADAEEELEELDETKIYVIGGLVDHNRYKGLCEQQARAAGIATARLPISRHVQLASRAVLTVNHVFQILVEYYACRDWAKALDIVLPKRKRADYAKQGQQQGRQQQQGARKEQPASGAGGGAAAKQGEKAGEEAATASGAAEAAAAAEAVGTATAVGAAAPEAAEDATAGDVGKVAAAALLDGGSMEVEAGDAEEGRGSKRKAECEPEAAD
ncbi:hypothetical protein PLESTB_001766900 [Pleodorina starrii]|uniref:tRNA (guanine(9)-N(1))-methyltransferase n=1 Tax=Pleodorina starrii TaxID=330485 RepID=A0A9W6C0J9_9CHLO|nr:hypothetical protein PLESTM_001862100 [Pleodorina starrii]GLC61533.1 hypothetical protein PLESTB_001766900 [Pleodorina starrii]GLC76813.1 hypothetical protein PLESTF_001843900 [Pleodorina starrii]